MAASYFTYTLGRTLHVPLTSKCNSQTLPQLRGNGFTLPVHVVAALCRVRDAERASTTSTAASTDTSSAPAATPPLPPPRWAGWCAYLDTQEGGRQKLPPPDGPALARLPPPPPPAVGEVSSNAERAPKLDDLLEEIRQQLVLGGSSAAGSSSPGEIESVVLSGEGEPTLRWNDMIELAARIREMAAATSSSSASHNGAALPIRLTTNGLIPVGTGEIRTSRGSIGTGSDDLPAIAQTLVDCGISRVSVGLITADAKQYEEIVQPELVEAGFDDVSTAPAESGTRSAHDAVCQFIQAAVRVEGLEVETTAIDRPDVDKARTEALSQSLGVSTPVRWRPYFP
jgi:hypothetical protein